MVSTHNINNSIKEPSTQVLLKLEYQSNIDTWWVSHSEKIFDLPEFINWSIPF